MEKINLGCIEYAMKQLPDGTTRPMTGDERAAFKPTHVTTYGENAKGQFCAYTTNLATNETETTVLSHINWTPDMLKLWQSVPEN